MNSLAFLRRSKPLPVGLISYSIYLWHLPIVILTGRLATHMGWPHTTLAVMGIYLPIVLVFLIPISWLSYTYLEVGVMRYFRKQKIDTSAAP